MKNKIAIQIILAILRVVIVAFSGCIEEESPTKVPEIPPLPFIVPKSR